MSLETALPLGAVSVVRFFCLSDVAIFLLPNRHRSSGIMRREGLYFPGFGCFDGPGSPTEGLWMNQAGLKIVKHENVLTSLDS
jgi:hypothetical protein